MTEQRLAEYVARTIAQAPPLNDEQRARIARILHPSSRPEAGGRR